MPDRKRQKYDSRTLEDITLAQERLRRIALRTPLQSREAGAVVELESVSTIADDIAIKRPEQLTFDIIQRHVDDIVTVSDDDIAYAIMMLLERNKLMVEGAGAVGVAALLTGQVDVEDHKVAVVLSGGNIDLNIVSQVVARGLGAAGRYLSFFTRTPDRPGALAALLHVVAQSEANVISVNHDRLKSSVALGQSGVDIVVETSTRAHQQRLLERLRAAGYDIEIVDVVAAASGQRFIRE